MTGETIEAWPFVVSRNPVLDWRPMLAPPFLIDAGDDFMLVHETASDGPQSAEPRIRRVKAAHVGPITLAFRRADATADLLEAEPAGQADGLRDRFGRPVSVVEGLVVRGHGDLPTADLRAALDRVRTETRALFPTFWQETDEAAPPTRSAPVRVSAPRERRGPPPGLVIAGIVGAIAFLVSRLRRGGDDKSGHPEDRSPDRTR